MITIKEIQSLQKQMTPKSGIVKRICKKYNIDLVDADVDIDSVKMIEPVRRITNRAFVYGDYRIVLGKFDCEEKKTAAFFHELGHIFDNHSYKNKYEQEKYAWEWGMQYAKGCGFYPSKKTVQWCDDQLATYTRHLSHSKEEKRLCPTCATTDMYKHNRRMKKGYKI